MEIPRASGLVCGVFLSPRVKLDPANGIGQHGPIPWPVLGAHALPSPDPVPNLSVKNVGVAVLRATD